MMTSLDNKTITYLEKTIAELNVIKYESGIDYTEDSSLMVRLLACEEMLEELKNN